MKKVLLMIVAVMALCGMARGAEPNEPVKGFTIWGLSADNADSLMILRSGFEIDRIEPGIGLKWFTGNPEWGPAPDVVSGYLIYHVEEFIKMDDPEPDNLLEEFLHQFSVRPYGGIEIAIPTQGEQRKAKANFIAGTVFSNDPTFKWAFVIEYIAGQGAVTAEDDWGVTIGARLRF